MAYSAVLPKSMFACCDCCMLQYQLCLRLPPLSTCWLLLQELFPFKAYFADAPGTLFAGQEYEADLEKARGCWRHLRTMFQELEECRAFELLKVRWEPSLSGLSCAVFKVAWESHSVGCLVLCFMSLCICLRESGWSSCMLIGLRACTTSCPLARQPWQSAAEGCVADLLTDRPYTVCTVS